VWLALTRVLCSAFPPSRSFQVRDYSYDAAGAAASAAEAARLTADVAARKANLSEWCRTSFGDAFSALLHVFAVRLFVESILRYGLPPAFASVLMQPDAKHAKRLRGVMASAFGRTASAHWKQREEDAAKGEEVHPYVSLTLELP
jgi:V-type H+-transporting ATPase subunit C